MNGVKAQGDGEVRDDPRGTRGEFALLARLARTSAVVAVLLLVMAALGCESKLDTSRSRHGPHQTEPHSERNSQAEQDSGTERAAEAERDSESERLTETEPLPTPADLYERFVGKNHPETLCDDSLLGPEFVLDDDSELPALYVDATANSGDPGGSRAAPFLTIAEALEAARGTVAGAAAQAPTLLRIAEGEYEEQLEIPSGLRLSGGYEANSWRRREDTKTVIRATTLTFLGDGGDSLLSTLEGFEILSTIVLSNGSRVLLRGNVVVPPLSELNPEDPRRAHSLTDQMRAVRSTGAALRADFNEFRVDAPEPESVLSSVFDITGGCARLTQNHFVDFRHALGLHDTDDVVFAFNVQERGLISLSLINSGGYFVGNVFQLISRDNGAFAIPIYLLPGARPTLRHNTFYLTGTRFQVIYEARVNSDPMELVGNAFFLTSEQNLLYVDCSEESDYRGISDIDELNSLTDIPVVRDNTLTISPQ